tara:strand:+ start:330 stop:578 length:249 start_codon:yes stop_codon:yes gene_type:complete
MIKEELMETLEENECLLADGFNEALIGVRMSNTPVAVYSYIKCIEILMRDMQEEEAMEYFDYNILCAYVGEKTPIFIELLSH